MTIRGIALELYSAQQKVEKLEKELAAASVEEEVELRQQLKAAQQEYQQLRNILNGRKRSSLSPRKIFK